MLQAVHSINGIILWANLHLLFWLSLIPFVTGWMGENHFSNWPVFLYGIVMLMCALAYLILSKALISHHGKDSELAKAVGKGKKETLSLLIYITAVTVALFNSWISFGLYILVAVLWFLPDRRIEKVLVDEGRPSAGV